MLLEQAERLVALCFEHPLVIECYKRGDKLSSNQTKHDIGHAFEVLAVGYKALEIVDALNPNLLDEWERKVILPLGLFLHDIGRCINVDKHDVAGAQWVMENLPNIKIDGQALPLEIIKRVARIVACHRTSRYVKVNFHEPALDIVIIADKCVGDEARVRWQRRLVYWFLTAIGLPSKGDHMREGDIHDRINYGIKSSDFGLDGNTMVLRMSVDRRVCSDKEIYELYGDRYHCVVIAANKLGFGFELEFDGQRMCEEAEGNWRLR